MSIPRRRLHSHTMRAVLLSSLVYACSAPTSPSTQSLEDSQSPPAQTEPLALDRGTSICLLGGALAERMQHDGWLETEIQARFPDAEITVRNLGFGADELDVHQRTMNFGKFSADGMESNLANERFVPWDRYLDHCDAQVVLGFFGYNESFAGPEGLPAFRENLETWIAHIAAQKYDGDSAPTIVLFTSIPHEDFGDKNLPDAEPANERIAAYNRAILDVASEHGVRCVDIFAPMQARYGESDRALTINGIHLNELGNRALAQVIDEGLFGPNDSATLPQDARDALREAVVAKNLLWFNRYRATDGYNVYGDRSRRVYVGAEDGIPYANFDVLQRELDHIDDLVANRDELIWALANEREHVVDDSNAAPLIPVATNKLGGATDGTHRYRTPDDQGAFKLAPGMQIDVFADERQFPELVNPVQMAWDTRGRLWVAAWQTYPHWAPGQPMNDKLLILEDTDGDGRANTCTVFADNLHNPTGFEFWNGGVLLAAAPDLLFLEDTDGDDRADHTERLLHGLSSADTHHGANSFVIGPDGALYFQEGTFHQSQVESVYGPVRNRNGCVWRFDPRTWRVERYIPYNYANPHGHVFDRWGQDFMTDGTGNVNYYALGFSGHLPQPLKHAPYFSFFPQRSRPAGGTEILSSRHFPDENQGNYLIANVIGFRGIFQYEFVDAGSGFGANEVTPIVESEDQNFRPVDIEMGPDGAIYFLDWHNALIGHLQHHLRDPSRDDAHGRVYRVRYADRELLQPEPIAGQSIEAILELLKSPEDRTRYRARLELSGRDSDEVVAAARNWASNLDTSDPDYEHHRLEALWLHQQHNRMDRELLISLLRANDYRARAAATRVVRYGRHLISDALDLLARQVRDEHPRVRLEAVVAASFFSDPRAASVALDALLEPTDKYLDYALNETMRALEPIWKAALRSRQPIADGNSAGIEFLLTRVSSKELTHLPRIPSVLKAILTRHGVDGDERISAAKELAAANGTEVWEEVLEGLSAADRSHGAHATHTILELGNLLEHVSSGGSRPRDEQLLELAESGVKLSTRTLGYAALVNQQGSLDAALASAEESSARMHALFASVEHIEAPGLRTQIGEKIRAMLVAMPDKYAQPSAGGGLRVDFYEPSPPDARRETFAGLTPRADVRTDNFTIDFPLADNSSSFGTSFHGVLFAPSDGSYTLSTRSDDGSRIYIGERCVVDNDGPHGALTRSGEIELKAGVHPIQVTFFESGGDESLLVTWSGPGFEEQEIPASALGSAAGRELRDAGIRALAYVPAPAADKLADSAALLAGGGSLGPVLDLLDSVDLSAVEIAAVEPALGAVIAYLTALSPEDRTTGTSARAVQLGREMALALPTEARARFEGQLDALGGSSVVIRTLPHQMLYDVREFSVTAGEPVSLVFQNNDVMPHNLVITLPGKMAEVGQAAEKLSGRGTGKTAAFVPETSSVVWHTGLVLPGDSERITFIAPSHAADHPYVCTYPGHWRVMNGVMHVVPNGVPIAEIERETSHADAAPGRPFVRDWTLADLKPDFSDGWERSASAQRGRELFESTGCSKCHTHSDQGSLGGPDAASLNSRLNGVDLLAHILDPSLEILPEYVFYIFELEDGTEVIGRIVEEGSEDLTVMPALLRPDDLVRVSKADLVERYATKLSPMPTGLLVTLTRAEILDLIKYVQEATQ